MYADITPTIYNDYACFLGTTIRCVKLWNYL